MKFKSNKSLAVLVPIFLSLVSCCNTNSLMTNGEVKVLKDGKTISTNVYTLDANLKDGQEVQILPDAWMDYYADLKANNNYLNVADYYTPDVENTKPLDVTITWTNTNDNVNYYVLYLSENSNMNEASSYFTLDESYTFSSLKAGTNYHYQIHAYYSEYTVISRVFNFNTVDFFRTIGIDGVQNARDLGNKYTDDGNYKIKQGLVYRSANLNSITELGKEQAKGLYGIKTDLDLRERQKADVSPLGEDINYINNANTGDWGSPYYVGGGDAGHGLDSSLYQEVCRDNLKVFANRNNYPIVFHCAVGRDRTGTLAVLLELLLGVKVEQVKVDYISYVFSSICNGVGQEVNVLNPNMLTIFNYLQNYDGTNNIYNGARQYAKDIGVTDEEISSIRNILLEEVA